LSTSVHAGKPMGSASSDGGNPPAGHKYEQPGVGAEPPSPCEHWLGSSSAQQMRGSGNVSALEEQGAKGLPGVSVHEVPWSGPDTQHTLGCAAPVGHESMLPMMAGIGTGCLCSPASPTVEPSADATPLGMAPASITWLDPFWVPPQPTVALHAPAAHAIRKRRRPQLRTIRDKQGPSHAILRVLCPNGSPWPCHSEPRCDRTANESAGASGAFPAPGESVKANPRAGIPSPAISSSTERATAARSESTSNPWRRCKSTAHRCKS
jgi:hypothetical protein